MSDNESWRSGFSSEFTDFTNNSESQTYEGLGSQSSNPNVHAQMMAQIMKQNEEIEQKNAEILELEHLLAIEKKKVNLTPTQGAICRYNELSGSGFNLYKNYKISVDLKLHRNTDNGPDGSYCRAVLVFKVQDQNQEWIKMFFIL